MAAGTWVGANNGVLDTTNAVGQGLAVLSGQSEEFKAELTNQFESKKADLAGNVTELLGADTESSHFKVTNVPTELTVDILNGAGQAKKVVDKTAEAVGDFNAANRISTNTNKVTWTSYNGKHVANKKVQWKKQVQGTQGGPAKYSPGTDIKSLELDIWENGLAVNNGKNWKVKKFDSPIGASGGKESRWVRVENNQGTIHGHPITEQEYNKLTTPVE